MHLENIMLSEMSDRERQILYIITYMWNLKNKTNKYIKQNINRLPGIENKLVVTAGREKEAEAI